MTSNNPLDKLFKDKLADFAQPPPANTWTRVEITLTKKNNGLIWIRSAAALLLVGAVLGAMSWLSNSPVVQSAKMTNSSPEMPAKEIQKGPVAKAKLDRVPRATRFDVKKKTTPTENPKVKEAEQQADVDAMTLIKAESPLVQPVLTFEETKVREPVERPIVLEYRLEEIKASSSVMESVADEKEKSGFRKVIDFAIDAKNSNPMADLRDAKDELFALNFKKDKAKNAK